MSQLRVSQIGGRRAHRGTVLFIVLWICLGLVTLAIYSAYTVNSELQAAANRVGEIEARQAVAGAIRYAEYVLNNYAIDGVIPNSGIQPDPTQDYDSAALQVGSTKGDAQFWFIGRDPNNLPTTDPVFGLVDEASKLNLNTVTTTMLNLLPMQNMTPDFAAAITAWKSKSASSNNATSSLYSTLDPGRTNKGAVYETTDELRLVYGATLDLVLGEDTNRNGAMDANENDGDQSPPHDNQDGVLQPGMLEYVTAFTNQPTTTSTGTARVDVRTATANGGAPLRRLLQSKGFTAARVTAIMRNFMPRNGQTPPAPNSVADFMFKSKMTAAEFALVHTSLTMPATSGVLGLVNVNTASETVLACIPGIGPTNAPALVAYRLANPAALTSFAWLPSVLSGAIIHTAGPYITDQSYQFSADIAAVGRNGRGYHREKVVFDTSQGIPRVIYRQDLTAFGWALGPTVRQKLKTAHLN